MTTHSAFLPGKFHRPEKAWRATVHGQDPQQTWPPGTWAAMKIRKPHVWQRKSLSKYLSSLFPSNLLPARLTFFPESLNLFKSNITNCNKLWTEEITSNLVTALPLQPCTPSIHSITSHTHAVHTTHSPMVAHQAELSPALFPCTQPPKALHLAPVCST